MRDERLQTNQVVEPNSNEERMLKYQVHKEANRVLKHYLVNENFIGAYLVSFSSLEDRIRAYYVTLQRDILGNEVTEELLVTPITRMVRELKGNYLERKTYSLIFKVAKDRNKLLHEAMWRLDAFNREIVEDVIKARNEVARQLAKTKREIAKESKKDSKETN